MFYTLSFLILDFCCDTVDVGLEWTELCVEVRKVTCHFELSEFCVCQIPLIECERLDQCLALALKHLTMPHPAPWTAPGARLHTRTHTDVGNQTLTATDTHSDADRHNTETHKKTWTDVSTLLHSCTGELQCFYFQTGRFELCKAAVSSICDPSALCTSLHQHQLLLSYQAQIIIFQHVIRWKTMLDSDPHKMW